MARHSNLAEKRFVANDIDPRDEGGAQVIDLATRNVLPTVTQRRKSDSLGLVAGIAIVAALGGFTLWSLDSVRSGPQQQPAAPAPAPQQAAAPAVAPPMAPPVAAPAAPAQLAAPAPSPVLAAPPQTGIAMAPTSNPHASPTIVFDASGLPVPMVGPAGQAGSAGEGNSNESFAARLGAVGGTKATAEASFDPRTTVTQGTLIPAVLETAINTDVPGYVRAVVSADVRSFDGARVLVPRSSRLIGEYKSGLQAGQKRAYVIWTRLIRPDGVSVNLASPAIGFGGETGLAGKVNGHFFQRFGSGLLLSIVGGLATGGAGVILGGGQSAASEAVSQNGKIGPTIRVRQGEPIRIFTAKDLDFSKVATK
ncbi:TrbI/VirB10 family protein [Croceicoccus sp. BE223]|uniref:TrbI/VirB10 family protein n=1 Tax=Croceicoccus sp. BE223 TaxID=2817716 RepID=UPI00285D6F48|nr:TrbI/VirB10 family protein [Croceicoccus sp. BE223]MDR7101939.1 type IV secretion system protein VirB10 [Croceicoccus sp. BE223]